MREKENPDTPIASDLAEIFEDSPRGREDMKRAVLASLMLCLVLIWAPMPSFSKVEFVDQPAQPKPQHTTIKPVADKPAEQVRTRDHVARRTPMPDLSPEEPELVVELEPIEDPNIIYSDDPFEDMGEPAPPAPVHSGPHIEGEFGLEVPVITKKVAPNYPRRGVFLGMQGYVIVSALMRADGTIDQIKVLRGLGSGKFGFEEEAIKAVQKWEFLPGKFRDKKVDVRLTLKIDFKLN